MTDDLAVLRHPEWFRGWSRTYSRFAVPRVVRLLGQGLLSGVAAQQVVHAVPAR